MKKTFKGFTLVECLVAMALLAIACMTLGGIEAAVARRNNANHFNNTSLANQMAYIEKYSNGAVETVSIKSTYTTANVPPNGTNSGTTAYVKVTKLTGEGGTAVSNNTYSYPVDIYVMYSRDNADKSSSETGYGTIAGSMSGTGSSEKEGNLRYKYVLGKS